jgi:hypothetical protein
MPRGGHCDVAVSQNPTVSIKLQRVPQWAAGDWYWEVSCLGDIVVARGLAPTRVRARAEAIIAAAPYLEGRQRRDPTLPLEERPL